MLYNMYLVGIPPNMIVTHPYIASCASDSTTRFLYLVLLLPSTLSSSRPLHCPQPRDQAGNVVLLPAQPSPQIIFPCRRTSPFTSPLTKQ